LESKFKLPRTLPVYGRFLYNFQTTIYGILKSFDPKVRQSTYLFCSYLYINKDRGRGCIEVGVGCGWTIDCNWVQVLNGVGR